jgi:hypothetical protein
VADINEQSAFVPSKGAFVDLVPDLWTADQADEAGRFLIRKAGETQKRGELFIQLAKVMRKSESKAA